MTGPNRRSAPAKHTPGPWRLRFIEALRDYPIDIVRRSRRNQQIGTAAPLSSGNRDEQVANARLMAAAPLLPECREVLRELTDKQRTGDRGYDLLARLDSALGED